MWDFHWVATHRNGIDVPQWGDDGEEQEFDRWEVCQFKFYRAGSITPELTILVPRGAYFDFWRERRQDEWIYVAAYQLPDDETSTIHELTLTQVTECQGPGLDALKVTR